MQAAPEEEEKKRVLFLLGVLFSWVDGGSQSQKYYNPLLLYIWPQFHFDKFYVLLVLWCAIETKIKTRFYCVHLI